MHPLNFNTLFNSGGYSLKVLIELSHPELDTWRFTNENEDVYYGEDDDGEPLLYTAVPMGYKPPSSKDGVPQGGTLEIDTDIQKEDGNGLLHELLGWFDRADDRAALHVTAVIKDGEIRPLGMIQYRYGSVSWDGKKIVWNISFDDRVNMQANPYQFNQDELTG